MSCKNSETFILGISCFYHDSAACLLGNGKILAAAQEERFTRKKHDPGFPEKQDKPDYYKLIREFEKLTGCAVLVNTSFNVRGEPIVCSPKDAYRCFMRTEMDVLVMENCILFKEEQPPWKGPKEWQNELILD